MTAEVAKLLARQFVRQRRQVTAQLTARAAREKEPEKFVFDALARLNQTFAGGRKHRSGRKRAEHIR